MKIVFPLRILAVISLFFGFALTLQAGQTCDSLAQRPTTQVDSEDLRNLINCIAVKSEISSPEAQLLYLHQLGFRLTMARPGQQPEMKFDSNDITSFYDTTKKTIGDVTLPNTGQSLSLWLAYDVGPYVGPMISYNGELLGRRMDAVVRTYTMIADTPPDSWREGPGNYYPAALFYKPEHSLSLLARYFPEQWQQSSASAQFAALARYAKTFDYCVEQRCTERLEKRVLHGVLMFFKSAALARSIFESRYSDFYVPQLQKKIGCGGDASNLALGWLGYRMDLPESISPSVNSTSMLGELLYIKAADRSKVHNQIYMGQNGLIRAHTLAAVKDLNAMGGLGGNSDFAMDQNTPSERMDLTWINTHFAKGASHRVMMYWHYRRLGQDSQAAQQISSPFFTDVSFFDGRTLKWWVEFAYRENPDTPYFLFTQDYFYRTTYSMNKSIGDRLMSFLRLN